MVIRPYDDGIINEFDSLDELRVFDPAFIENVDSDIFDNIVQILGCSKSEIHDVYPLKQGLTNLSCHFATDSGEYVYRHPGVGTELLIDREGEVAAQKVARELGLDGTYIFEDPKRGWKISKFIPNCRNIDPHDAGQVAKTMRMAHDLHACDVIVDRHFNFFREAKRYEALLLEKGPIDIPRAIMNLPFASTGSHRMLMKTGHPFAFAITISLSLISSLTRTTPITLLIGNTPE